VLASAWLTILIVAADPLPRERVVLCGLSAAAAQHLTTVCERTPGVVVRTIDPQALREVVATDQAAIIAAYGFPLTALRAAVGAQVLAPLPAELPIECSDLIDPAKSALPQFLDPVVVVRGARGEAAWQPTWDALDVSGAADALVFEIPRHGTASAAWFAALATRDDASAERHAQLLELAGANALADAPAVLARVAALGTRAFAVVRRSAARRVPGSVFDDLAEAAVEAPMVVLGTALGFGAAAVDPALTTALFDRELARVVADAEGLIVALPLDATPRDVLPARKLAARTLELEDAVLAALARRRLEGRTDRASEASEWFDVIAIVVLVGALTLYLWRRRRVDAAAG
jgi:hypothetical protein